MEERAAPRLLTIGQLSETGVPVRTIRFYSDTRFAGAALVEPAARTARGYRLYDREAAARLEFVRTLRDLGIDLPTIARVLAKQVTVAEVARGHADALEAAVRVIRLRQAVLRAVAARGGDWMEMELMHRLARLDATQRRQILDGYLEGVFGGLDGELSGRETFEQMMRSAFPELPAEPTPGQVEAWVRLVAPMQDEGFVARCRQMAEHAAAKRAQLSEERFARDQAAYASILAPESQKAYLEGLDPAGADGRVRAQQLLAAWAEATGAPAAEARAQLLETLELYSDRRVDRFWELVAVVAGRPRPRRGLPRTIPCSG
jgi:DNA-binding transcriptional MerR regulator